MDIMIVLEESDDLKTINVPNSGNFMDGTFMCIYVAACIP